MADRTCPYCAPVGDWCRRAANLRCPAGGGRAGCPFFDLADDPSIRSTDARRAAGLGRGPLRRQLAGKRAQGQLPLLPLRAPGWQVRPGLRRAERAPIVQEARRSAR